MSGTQASKGTSQRLFSAFELSRDALAEVERVEDWLRTEIDARKWQKLENMHLTLHFFGEVQNTAFDDLKRLLGEQCRLFPPFMLQLGSLGTFPKHGKPRVLWLGLEGEIERLRTMESAMRLALEPTGLLAPERRYSPHVTLARELAHPIPVAEVAPRAQIKPLTWMVDELVLFHSQLTPKGSIYTPLERFPLQG